MTGHKISLGKSARIKNGKVVVVQLYRDASHKIASLKSKKVRVGKKVPT